MSETKPPIHVVCGIIERENRILLAQRPAGKRLAGLWEFPGGKVELDETPVQALHRELAEELGCEVIITREGPAVPWVYEWGSIVLHSFVCRLADNSSEPHAHEHQAIAWLPQAQIRTFDLAPADGPIVDWLLQPGEPG
jgi:8-oxo-dGTP diphosphatase